MAITSTGSTNNYFEAIMTPVTKGKWKKRVSEREHETGNRNERGCEKK